MTRVREWGLWAAGIQAKEGLHVGEYFTTSVIVVEYVIPNSNTEKF
jgi:hypothetical protein